jgi:hypothetical protein
MKPSALPERWKSMFFCVLAFVCACAKAKDKGPASNSATPVAQAPSGAPVPQATSAGTATGCRGTMSGTVSGSLTCESGALFFLPAYKDANLRGNTEVSLMSSSQLRQGSPPPGVELVSWAGVVRGALQPGTYTEKNLIHSMVDAAVVDLTGHKRLSGLQRMKLVVKSISAVGVHDDMMLKQGPLRSDKIVGEIELVIGDASGQVVIHATLN